MFLKEFGGTYFRPIYSSITNKEYKNDIRNIVIE